MLLKFREFINESKINEGAVPIYREGSATGSFDPAETIKSTEVLSRIQSLLNELSTGLVKEINVVAEIPSQGKNAPSYLKDLYRDVEDEEDLGYDPETDTYSGRKDYDETIFVDSEFIVTDVDMEKKVLIAEPYSLKNKGIMVEIPENKVEEIFIK